jgi:hypothetical protein
VKKAMRQITNEDLRCCRESVLFLLGEQSTYKEGDVGAQSLLHGVYKCLSCWQQQIKTSKAKIEKAEELLET